MSTVEAKVSRLEELRATLSQQVARRDELQAWPATSADRETQLLGEHYKTSLSPPGATSAVSTERRKRKDNTAEVERLNASITALNASVVEEEAKQREVSLAEIRAELTEKQDAVRAGYRACGTKFAELNNTYAAYLDTVRELEEFRTANQWRIGEGDAADQWRDTVAHLVVQPVPGDLGMLCADLFEVTMDPGANGYRRDIPTEQRAYDEQDEARLLTQDLRNQNQRLVLLHNSWVRYSRNRWGTGGESFGA